MSPAPGSRVQDLRNLTMSFRLYPEETSFPFLFTSLSHISLKGFSALAWCTFVQRTVIFGVLLHCKFWPLDLDYGMILRRASSPISFRYLPPEINLRDI